MKPFLIQQLERYALRLTELDFLLSREDIMGDMVQYRTLAREHADVTALDEAEAPGPTGDLREFPRQQVASRLAVELRRLREQQRLAGEVDAVPEHVRRDADVCLPVDEAVDLLAPRRERHRAAGGM